MSCENTESLPPLACPLIGNSAEGVGRDEKPLRQPPFPGIDRRWDGFTLSHLHLVGINGSRPHSRKWLIKLTRLRLRPTRCKKAPVVPRNGVYWKHPQ